jgi:exosortase A
LEEQPELPGNFAGYGMKDRTTALKNAETDTAMESTARWRFAAGLAIAGVLALLGIYHETFLSMVDIWRRSETFAHGFLIFPISAWLVWRRVSVVARISPRPDYRAVPIFFLLGLGWLMARVAGVLVVEQYALVGMIPVLVWMLLGWRVISELAFPLGFLLFAVPVGEFLIPPMMGFTADFTVKMLQLTGIPVFREGTFFSIPSGDWSVVEGCSGLRYLIASITLGFLYAYLSYRSPWRRLAFILLAIVFPVIANGLRAYMIVMIAHLSDMKLALGVDHFIYGWVFFGLVMLLLFWLGSLWAEPDGEGPAVPLPAGSGFGAADGWALWKCLAVGLALSVLWPARAAHIEHLAESRNTPVDLALPDGAGLWRSADPSTDWEPSYVRPDAKAVKFYSDGSATVGLYLMYYRYQEQGAELINSQNMLIRQKHPVWKMPGEKPESILLNGKTAVVLQGHLQSSRQRLLTWRWNRIGELYTANDYIGKLLEARDKILGAMRDEAGIVIATEYGDDPQSAAKVLQRFVDAMLPSLEESLNRATRG